MSDCVYIRKCNGSKCDEPFCIRKAKLDDLYENAKFSQKQRKHVVLKLDQDLRDKDAFMALAEIEKGITDFVNAGKNLYIFSAICGNGKTSWAIRMVQTYFSNNWSRLSVNKCYALFISTPSYLNSLKKNISSADEYATYINDNIYEADIVIWDDIAQKVGTEYELDQLFSVINRRIQDGKTNIFTSNVDESVLPNFLGARLSSRICGESINIKLVGADKRHLAYKEADANGNS